MTSKALPRLIHTAEPKRKGRGYSFETASAIIIIINTQGGRERKREEATYQG
jgi:hypothetical protein